MPCLNCGSDNPDGARECLACGAPTAESISVRAEAGSARGVTQEGQPTSPSVLGGYVMLTGITYEVAKCPICGSELLVYASPARFTLRPGTQLGGGKYTVEAVLGQGGHGITYLAHELDSQHKIAIREFFPFGKCTRQHATVHPDGQVSPADYELARQKFLDEARILAKFHHPGIVQVYTTFEENNTAYFVMEYVEGKTLLSMVEARSALPEKEVVEYARQVGEALTVIHQANLLHRDIKPENVLLRKNEHVVLVDFHAAGHFAPGQTRELTAIVTPGYAPLDSTDNVRGSAHTPMYTPWGQHVTTY
jgi:serine/threonine protein kinase